MAKIGILSDIHVDINMYRGKDRVTESICSIIRKRNLDIFIIAGDIASDYTLTLSVIKRIEKETEARCIFVPGNHDIWTEHHPELTSWDIYNKLKEHPGNLSAGSFEINKDWAIAGDLGWYDYKFGSSKYSIEDFNLMRYEDRIWQDSIMAKWDRTTIEMHTFFLKNLKEQLDNLGDKNIILVTHVLPVREFTVQDPPPMWEYLNAFMGSPDYGTLALKYPGVKYSISGHVHYRKQFSKQDTTFICNCLGYSTEWKDTDDPMVEVPKAVVTIEV